MKTPFLADKAFLADVNRVRQATAPGSTDSTRHQLHVWWLGQSGFLVAYDGSFLLLDPYLSDSLTRKYAGTDKPHVRVTGRVVDPARLDFVAAVTSSHNHTDHLDPETLKPLLQANPGLVAFCPEANRSTVRERSGLSDDRILGLDVPEEALAARTIPEPRAVPGTPFRLAPIPAAHEALDRDASGRLIYLGFLLHVGPFRIYHSGDTVLFDGLEAILRARPIDLALLPINGRAPERRVAGNLNGTEAARLAHDVAARVVVPCHYDMFEFNTASPDEFVEACRSLDQPHRVMEQGGRLSLDPRP
ncbi:MAG: MBL fold metallo-hydrolase [Limisphaerales bacterium]